MTTRMAIGHALCGCLACFHQRRACCCSKLPIETGDCCVVPLAAGGGAGHNRALYAEPLAQSYWASRIVVDNRPGAALMVAASAVKNAPPVTGTPC